MMTCESFGICGGCNDFIDYSFQSKCDKFINDFALISKDITYDIYPSIDSKYRARAEFRFHTDDKGMLHYASNSLGKNERVKIASCPALDEKIYSAMPMILEQINKDKILSFKLYGISLLSTLSGELAIWLIYHRRLDDIWEDKMRSLSTLLDARITGISKGQKIGASAILEKFSIKDRELLYIRKIGRFSQPNPYINQKMLTYVIKQINALSIKGDLLELYCGSGNFTIALSPYFDKIFATEVVKDSISMLKENISLNNISNITIARLNAKESIQAFKKERAFFRLKDIDLASFHFSSILVDPPRSGIKDLEMLSFISSFRYIIYVSCNPISLKEDLSVLLQTHHVVKFALFDQFPNTHHIESICILESNSKIWH